MLYAAARPQIRNGDAFSFRGTEESSRRIMAMTDGDVSHVGLAYWLRDSGMLTRDRLCVLEAWEDGVHLRPLTITVDEYLREGGLVWWHPLSPQAELSGCELAGHALDHWGRPYPEKADMLAVKSSLVRFFMRLFGRTPCDTTIHCSQLIAHALEECGVMLDKDAFQYSPHDVVRLRIFNRRIDLQFEPSDFTR